MFLRIVCLLLILFHSGDGLRSQSAEINSEKSTWNVFLMGNSITSEWSRLRPEFFTQHILDQDTCVLFNRGVTSETTRQMLLRYEHDILSEQPDVVVLLAGINDVAENEGSVSDSAIVGNIERMILDAKAKDAQVVLCSILPVKTFHWRKRIQPADRIVSLNFQLKALAERTKSLWLDYHVVLSNAEGGMNPELAKDGVHPTAAGYAIMEPLLLQALDHCLH